MTPDNTIWVQLGLAAPLVGILLFLLKQSTDERKDITSKFLVALQTTVNASNEARLRTADEVANLTSTLRDVQKHSTEEHNRIVDAIGKLELRRANGRQR